MKTNRTFKMGTINHLDDTSIVTIVASTHNPRDHRLVTFISHADGRDWFIAPNGDHVRCEFVDEIQDPVVSDALQFLIDNV